MPRSPHGSGSPCAQSIATLRGHGSIYAGILDANMRFDARKYRSKKRRNFGEGAKPVPSLTANSNDTYRLKSERSVLKFVKPVDAK
jgi:hypothetical protein